MGPFSRETWAQRLGTFRASPSAFMAGPEGEDLGRDLLSDLRSEKLSEPMKVALLALSLEYPAQLWPDAPAAEAAATSLLDTLVLLPPRPSALRRPLLLAATTALVAGGALSPASGASGRLLPLLLGLASGRDLGRSFGPASEQRPLQATAWECLRELESCRPGLLGGCLGLLRALLGREGPAQPLSLLLALALRNALVIQARAGAGLQGLLTAGDSSMEGGPWNWTLAEEGEVHLQPQAPSWPAAEEGECGLAALELSPEEARELRATVAQLLDSSYLLTPVAFHQDQFYCLGTGAAISKGLQSDQQLKPCYTEITVGRNGRPAHGRSDHSLTHTQMVLSRLQTRLVDAKPLSMVVIHLNQAFPWRLHPAREFCSV